MKILVTGAAGFIGSQLAYALSMRGDELVGLDNINEYYDTRLKYGRLKEAGFYFNGMPCPSNVMVQSTLFPNYRFIRLSLEDKAGLELIFAEENFDKVVNLAAQAGVRYSITNPSAYADSNLIGFLNILECCRNYKISHLVYASSSSVYGMNEKVPFSEDDQVDTPVSLYAATKRANELMAHSYCKLYDLPVTGLRYFTVYGPWGRPDMAPMLFASAISAGVPIKIFNGGDLSRDFTYVDDIVAGTIGVLDNVPISENCSGHIPYKIYNIGCSDPVRLMDFIHQLESALGVEAKKEYLPMQPGDVFRTYADVGKLVREVGYKPIISLSEGVERFVRWYESDKNPLK